MEVFGDIKNYDWGKLGSESEVTKLASVHDENFIVDEEKPYSELWMGDHVSGPSKLKATGESLAEFIQKDRDGNIGGQEKLPFLFKVLSIRKVHDYYFKILTWKFFKILYLFYFKGFVNSSSSKQRGG